MKISNLSYVLLLLFFVGACKCPPDEKVGELELTTEALSWLPYTGGESLRFTNSSGGEMILSNSSGMDIQENQLCFRTICTEQKIKGESTCQYYGSESRQLIFFSADSTFLLDYLVYSEVYDSEGPKFIDLLRVATSSEVQFGNTQTVIGQHFTGTVDASTLSLNGEFDFLGTVTLNGTVYADVYGDTTQNIRTYVTQADGLVAFELLGELWNLE